MSRTNSGRERQERNAKLALVDLDRCGGVKVRPQSEFQLAAPHQHQNK
jgi:hypothetical protein